MQTTLNFDGEQAPLSPIAVPFDMGRWTNAKQWFEGYRMLCMARRHTLYDTHKQRRDAFDEAIRRHVRALASPGAQRLLRRDTDRTAIARIRRLLDHTRLIQNLLPLDDRMPIILFLHAREGALS